MTMTRRHAIESALRSPAPQPPRTRARRVIPITPVATEA